MKTTITNNSGHTQFFGFILPHGKTLTNGESVVIDGSLRTMLGDDRWGNKRSRQSLDDSLALGHVWIEEVLESASSSSV